MGTYLMRKTVPAQGRFFSIWEIIKSGFIDKGSERVMIMGLQSRGTGSSEVGKRCIPPHKNRELTCASYTEGTKVGKMKV